MRQNVHGNVPWYLDGLDPDTRDAAREAARRAGVSLDEWLHATISDRAARAFSETPPTVRRKAPAPQPQNYDDLDAVASRIARVTRGRGSQGQQRGGYDAPGRPGYDASARGAYEAPPRGVDAIVAAVGAEAERRTRESATRTAEALDSVARWIERAEDRMSESTRVLSEGTRMALERQDRAANVLGEALALMTKRLDDIERKVVEGRNPPVGAAMEAMSKIESHLARLGDLDDRRAGAAPDAESALRGFEQRIAAIAERLGAAAPGAAYGDRDARSGDRKAGDRLEALRAEVARLAGQLETIRPARESLDVAAARLSKGVGDLAVRVASLATREDITSLERSLQELAREAVSAAKAGREADLERINGLVERAQTEIERIAAEAASGAYRDAGREYRSLTARVEELASSDQRLATRLSQELETVRDALARLAEPERLGDLQDQIRDLSQRVGHLARNQVTPVDFAGLRSAVEEIRGAVRKTPAEGADLAAIERQYGSIVERLSGLNNDQPREELARLSETVSTMADKLDALAGTAGKRETELLSRELAAMAAGLVDLRDGAKAADVEALSERVEVLGRRIDALAGRAPEIGRELAGLRRSVEDGLLEIRSAAPAELEALNARLDRLVKERPSVDLTPVSEQIARLSEKLENLREAPRPEIGKAVESLAARLDRLAAQRPSVDLTPVSEQLARLSEKLEDIRETARPEIGPAVESLAARLDRLAEQRPSVDLGPVAEQIARLSEKLGDARETSRGPELEALMERIDRLDENVRAIDVRGGVRSLEDMLAQLASRLDAADRPNAGAETVDALEKQIEAIAGRLEREREASVDAVARAARSAVSEGLASLPAAETSARADIDDLTRTLTELKELHSLTQERGVEAVGGVQTTLDKVVQRLASLEARMQPGKAPNAQKRRAAARPEQLSAPAAAKAAPAAPVASGPAAAIGSFGPEMTPSRLLDLAKARAGVGAPTPATSLQDEADRPVATLGTLGGDIPLEPGSGRPRPATETAGDDASQIKASFIAAARRAAQNAAAEAAAASRRSPVSEARGARPAASQEKVPATAGRRRPLLMAAAAVVLAIGAFQIGSNVIGGAEQTDLAGEPRELADAVLADLAPSEAERLDVVPALPAPAPALAAAQETPAEGAWPTETASIDAGGFLPEEPSVIGMEDLLPLEPAPAIAGEAAESVGAPLPPRRAPAFAASETARLDASPATAPASPSASPAARATTLYPSMVSAEEIPADAGPEELRQAVLAGDVSAVYELASRAADGRGMNRDPALAAKLFERAAAHGLVPAQFRIGNHYEKGIGVARDFSLATLWYQRAAESGNARAMHNLAVLLAEGVNGRPDYEAALGWFRRAAEHGVRDSQYNLAVLLARGLGTQQNLEESYVWFAIAAQQGDEDAAGKRDEVASRLEARTLAMARARVEGWRPEIPRPEANEVAFPIQTPEASQARRAGIEAFAG